MIDSAHGHTSFVMDAIRYIKDLHTVDVIAGNIATGDAAAALIDAGADAVKVGIEREYARSIQDHAALEQADSNTKADASA